MGIYRTIWRAAVACSLLAASGAAMAADCSEGVIRDERVSDIEINGQSCVIIDVDVRGHITIQNSPVVLILDSIVDDAVVVRDSGIVTVIGTRVQKGRMTLAGNDQATAIDNNVEGDMRINRNISAIVEKNSTDQNLACRNNTTLDASLNRAKGSENCR